jgi:hypothetical protein
MVDREQRIADGMNDWLASSCPGWSAPIPADRATVLRTIRRLEAQLQWLWAMDFDVRDWKRSSKSAGERSSRARGSAGRMTGSLAVRGESA